MRGRGAKQKRPDSPRRKPDAEHVVSAVMHEASLERQIMFITRSHDQQKRALLAQIADLERENRRLRSELMLETRRSG